MRYLDEYRDPVLARRLVTEIRATATRRWPIMEVCGGQTHTIVRQGIDELIPVRMAHGPGSGSDLLSVKARGGDVRVVYSPLDAVRLAKTTPSRQVVFFAPCPRRGRWRRPARSRLAGGTDRAPARRLDPAGRPAADRNSVKRITPSWTTGPTTVYPRSRNVPISGSSESRRASLMTGHRAGQRRG